MFIKTKNKKRSTIIASYKYICSFLMFLTSPKRTFILLYIAMLRREPPFISRKCCSLKTGKTSYISSNSLLYLQKFFPNQNKDYIFMIRKDWSFCYQNLQFVAILHKIFKFSCSFLSSLILLFPKMFSIVIFHLTLAFQRYQMYFILSNVQKAIAARQK